MNMMTLTAVEESVGISDARTESTTFTVPSDVLTAEELIRSYVYQVHRDREYAVRQDAVAKNEALTPEEKTLNAQLSSGRKKRATAEASPDWKESAQIALDEYRNGRLLVFVDDQQMPPGDVGMAVSASATVRFVRIMLLAGG